MRAWLRELGDSKGWQWIARRAKLHPERVYQIAQGAKAVPLEVERLRDLYAELNPPTPPDHQMQD